MTFRKWFKLPGRGHNTLRVELALFSPSLALEIVVGGDDLFTFHLALPLLFSVWISVSCWPLKKRLRLPHEKHITGFYLSPQHNWMLVVQLWQNEMEWKRGGWQWTFILNELLLGRRKCEKGVIEERAVTIPMPEAEYPATAKLCWQRWTQPRAPWWKREEIYVDFEIPGGIPHPGKGTTEYNCGDDALIGGGFKGETIKEGIQEVINQVNWYRKNYPL